MKKGEKFEITYKSIGDTERREIESIRSRYMGASESDDKIVRLQRLDFLVRKLPIFISVALCIVGLLVFGTGLAFVLELNKMSLGAALGAGGLVIMIIAYPIYKAGYIFQRKRYAGQILRLTDELLDSNGGNTRG